MASLTPVCPPQEPVSIIFLDVDGVLFSEISPSTKAKIIKKINELFEKKGGGFTKMEWGIAQSHFFSKAAVGNLMKLIERVSKVSRVVIVISSSWKLAGTVEELRDRIFAIAPFSKLIIDKIPANDEQRKEKGETPLSPIAKQKYGFILEARGEQIDFWLRENYDKVPIKSFVILDDQDDGISERYPHNFVSIKQLLSEADVDKAYKILTESLFSPEMFPSEDAVAKALIAQYEEETREIRTVGCTIL